MKKLWVSILLIIISFQISYAETFNSKMTEENLDIINSGEILIKNIDFKRNMCLNDGINELCDELHHKVKKLNPKYLAEIIQIKPYEGNEDLPQRLEAILKAIPDYAGIPYFSERGQTWYDLYSSAKITKEETVENITNITADFDMAPFGIVTEKIQIKKIENSLLYTALNTNKLRYHDQFDCIWPEKMLISIYLFRDGDNWILYGIGGVNAPRVPFLTKRIETSFINRIKTFCDYVFKQF